MKHKLIYLGDYHKYWLGPSLRNPKFDQFSGFVLDVKDQKPVRIIYFARRLEQIIPKEVVVCAVPSSDAAKFQTGIKLIALRLCIGGRVDGTSCLRRLKTVPKAAHGGPRGIRTHIESVCIENGRIIVGQDVYLLDDVVTTGSSLEACAQLLEASGAASVTCVALGKTVEGG